MSNLVQSLKKYQLLELYLSLPVEQKQAFEKYLPKSCDCTECEKGLTKPYPLKSTARLLWITAANALPHYKYEFAETLLNKALEISEDKEDSIWIHANLVQLYYDQMDTMPEALAKCRLHCKELHGLGFKTKWIKQVSEEINLSADSLSSDN